MSKEVMVKLYVTLVGPRLEFCVQFCLPHYGKVIDEDSNPFCATSLEQYYSWNIGKRRAAEWQRAVAVRKILQEVMEKCSRFSSTDVMKTKQIMYWCRQRGYTPPDPETAITEEDSMEDILTRIDNEP
eukprot:g46142.t1